MARQVLPIVGAVVGAYFGNPQLGWAIGSAIGNAVDPQVIKGPSIGDITNQTSQEGVPRPIIFALSPPIAGNVIATSQPEIVRSRRSQGKGGPKVETESVFRTYAIGVCEGPIAGFIRVWRNSILVYDVSDDPLLTSEENADFLTRARFFTGGYDQNPSPDLEAIFGVGTTPAHRGTAYMVMADDDLTDLRGAIPQYAFQVSDTKSAPTEIIYTSNDIWLKPSGLVSATVLAIGAGAGAGSGANRQAGNNGAGGGGGGGGGASEETIAASLLGETEVVTVGIGGGGATPVGGITVGNGNDGSDGGSSSFGSHVTAGGGLAGEGGTASASTGFGGIGGEGGSGTASNGGKGANCASASAVGPGGSPSRGGGGGGAGSGQTISGGGDSSDGGAGNTATESNAGGAAGVSAGQAGGSGSPSTDSTGGGGGGGGGRTGGNSSAGGSGGAGGFPGGGGGGGGSSTAQEGIVSGPGGSGAGGMVRVIHNFTGEPSACRPLREVVEAIAARAGMEPGMVDASQLEGSVCGFAIINTYPAYAALRSLSEIFLFDPSNYDGKIHFVHRGGNSVATVTEDDMIDDGTWIDESKRSDAIQIPRVLHLNYHDLLGGLATDKQSSERSGDRRSVGESSLQSAVVMDADTAASAIYINHAVMVEDQKGELKFGLPDSFIRLAVANPIVVQWQGRSERCRITQCDIDDGYQKYTCLRDRQSAYTSEIEGIPPAPQTPPVSSVVGPTIIELLDIQILRDADDRLGYYVAVSGITEAWQGANVELSYDGGQNYIEESSTNISAVIGSTLTVLGDHPQAYPDQHNSVRVLIHTTNAELMETDLSGLLNRENMAIIGDELIQFANAEEESEGEWVLSYLIRGRKGTETQEHAIGSRFVLLDRGSLAFIDSNLTDLNRTLTFRATSFGQSTDQGTVVSMTFSGESQTERQPAYLTVTPDGTNLNISWQGVGRLGAGVQVAHGINFSGYRVTIEDISSTITVNTQEQSITQDVSSLTPPLTVRVYQLNNLTGPGPYIEAIV